MLAFYMAPKNPKGSWARPGTSGLTVPCSTVGAWQRPREYRRHSNGTAGLRPAARVAPVLIKGDVMVAPAA